MKCEHLDLGVSMEFENRTMTCAEREALQTFLNKISDIEKSPLGISKSIDDLQSILLLMIDSATIVLDTDMERYEE